MIVSNSLKSNSLEKYENLNQERTIIFEIKKYIIQIMVWFYRFNIIDCD